MAVRRNSTEVDRKSEVTWCLYDLAHAAGRGLNSLHDLARVVWFGSVLFKSCATNHCGKMENILSRSSSIRGDSISIVPTSVQSGGDIAYGIVDR